LSLADARDRAEVERGKVSKGTDPMAERRGAREAKTFGELCDRFLVECAANKRDEGERDKWMVTKFLRPKLGQMKAGAVTYDDCSALILKIREGAPVLSNRVHGLLRRIFSWGIAARVLPANTDNPARGIPQAREKPRQKVLPEAEIVALWRALEQDRPQE
jgi:hypothetical protein